MAIPVKLGERVIGEGYFDEEGYFHFTLTDESDDVAEFLGLHHDLTYLSLAEDGQSAELELRDDVTD